MIGKIETAERACPSSLAYKLDEILDTGGVLSRAWPLLDAHQRQAVSLAPEAVSGPTAVTGPNVSLHGAAEPGGEGYLKTASGRFFAGARIEVQISRATRREDKIRIEEPPAAVTPVQAQLLVGIHDDADGPAMVAIDARRKRRRLRQAPGTADISIPGAYVLDDLTTGLLWAASSLDRALLFDDALISERKSELDNFEKFPRSSAGRDMAAELTAVSQLWMGSDFCARYILRQSSRLTSTPDFWTRERTGEEASTWLLFAHKYSYLKALSERFPTGATRSFCIPELLVGSSPQAERFLIVLAAALMESFGIRIQVCSDPEYSTVEGFVLDPYRWAIIASWLGTDGIWHVDTTDSMATVREYTDITAYASAHSVIDAPTPHERLRAFADYLNVEWSWLVRRCAELSTYGIAGLLVPSSRLLSTTGIDRACRFLGKAALVKR